MLCPTCNADVPADAAFCPKCGQQLTAVAGQSAMGGTAGLPSSAAAVAPPSAAERLRGGQHAIPHEEEKELWRGRYTPRAMYGNWVLAGIVTIGLAVVAILMPNPIALIAAAIIMPLAWIIPAIRLLSLRLKYEYTLTTQRFLHKQGVLEQVADQILLVDVDDINYKQSLLGRMLNFGTITLLAKDMSLAAKGDTRGKLTLVPVEDVQRVFNLIDEARREERRKRALYMANA
jgi:hypothetical protein